MIISIPELFEKFPILQKFKDQKWLCEEAIKADCNHKELPLKAALALINELLNFIQKNKFNSHWEEGFSVKVYVTQMRDLLLYFCEDTIEEKTVKGDNISPRIPIPK